MKKIFRMTLRRKSAISGWLFILPWLIGFVLFFVQPIMQTVRYSTNQLVIGPGGLNYTPKGMSYFETLLLKDTTFRKVLLAGFGQTLLNVPVVVIFSFFISVILKEKFRGNAAVKVVFFLPVIMASAVYIAMSDAYGSTLKDNVGSAISSGAGTLKFLKALDFSGWLYSLGLDNNIVMAVTTPINKIFSIISLSGIQIFIFLAGLNSIQPSMYEASVIEGATGWESFWKITFPMISPLILVNVVYTMIESFTAFSNPVIAAIYQTNYKLQYSMASAMSLVYFILTGLVVLVVGFLISRMVFYYN
jgi:ABC-type sugar transport system permease subunit